MTCKCVCAMGVAALFLCVLVSTVSAAARFKSLEEWTLWKDDHSRQYLNAKVRF